MKTSLKKWLNLHYKNNCKDRKIQPLAQINELAKAYEVMQDIKDCYDSLLSAAAAATNSTYEFSESLSVMGVCLLQKIGLNDDEDSGKTMLKLGKVQFKLQKLVDSYRNHIIQTITVPSESLINELHTLEEMKLQCDEKREKYEYMKTRYRDKGRSKRGKGETFSLEQVQVAKDEFDEEAALFAFRLQSLKQGQPTSLLTQAARHHAAQLSFFRKAVKSLEAVEPHVNLVTQQQHIDYHSIDREDEYSDDVGDDGSSEDDDSINSSVEGYEDLRVDFPNDNKQISFVSAARNTLEVNTHYEDSLISEQKMLSQSAPLFPQRKCEPAEKIGQLWPLSSRKFHSYALPKPVDTITVGAGSPVSLTKLNPLPTELLYHSSPLVPNKFEKLVGTELLSRPIILNAKSIVKESNDSKILPPLTNNMSVHEQKPQTLFGGKILKLQSYSGPLTSKPSSTKASLSTGYPVISRVPKFSSGPILRGPVPSSSSPTASPIFTSPTINELHELPRPPVHFCSGKSSGAIGFSAPLVSSDDFTTNKSSVPKIAS
ncbi:unnamed protein product [Amaranthus hypochondriacus]